VNISGTTILEAFREREAEIKRECEKLDKELSKKRAEQEKIQADALAKLAPARAALAGMKADYSALEARLTAESAAELRETEVTAAKVEAGTVSLKDFLESGLSEKDIKSKARVQANEKLAEGRRLILEKQLEIFRLEAVEAEARENVIYCSCYPGMTQIQKLRAEIEVLERGIAAVNAGSFAATNDKEQAKLNVALSEGRGMSGKSWDLLSVDELKDLRFDPRVQRYAGALDAFIEKARPEARYNVFLRVAAWGNDPGLSILQALK
jgi:hypothetical protein